LGLAWQSLARSVTLVAAQIPVRLIDCARHPSISIAITPPGRREAKRALKSVALLPPPPALPTTTRPCPAVSSLVTPPLSLCKTPERSQLALPFRPRLAPLICPGWSHHRPSPPKYPRSIHRDVAEPPTTEAQPDLTATTAVGKTSGSRRFYRNTARPRTALLDCRVIALGSDSGRAVTLSTRRRSSVGLKYGRTCRAI
jgi:hypothetical protein